MTTCSTNTCGVGGWGGPLPGDPDNNSVLTATPAFGGIDVSWTYPGTNPQAVAHVILYRAVSSDFNSAIVIATVGGNFFYDKSTSPQLIQYYYWITIVSVNGTVGAPIGPASAIAKPPIASVIEGLTAQIDAGFLAQSLKTEIDKITLNYDALLSEVDSRIAANTALSAALLQVQNGVDQSLAFINQEITQRQEGDSALVSQVNTVAAANASNLALIQQEQIARVDGDSANAALYTTLNSQVNNSTTGLPATRATLINDYYTKTQTNSAISSATTSLVSTTALNTALGAYTTTAALQNSYYTKTQTDSAIASATTTLVSNTQLNTTLGSYVLTATLQNNYYTKAQADSITSLSTSTVIASSTGITRLRYWGFESGLESWSSTYATAANGVVTWTPTTSDSSFTRTLSSALGEQYLGSEGPIIAVRMRRVSGTGAWEGNLYYGTSNHGISSSYRKQVAVPENPNSWTTVKWDMRELTSGGTDYVDNTITQLRFDFVSDGNTSVWEIDWIMIGSATDIGAGIAAAETSLEATIDKVTGIGALYTAKLSVNGLIGGFGVYNDGSTVQAGFDVDEFWVGKTQANKRKPFIISGGVTYIDDAAIEKLTFTKLRDSTGSFVVENGKVKADYINVTKITGGAYTEYAWPTSGTGFYLGPGGLLMGNYNTGKYLQLTDAGDLYAPGFSIVNGSATFSGNLTANTVTTTSMAGNAVTDSYTSSSTGGSTSLTVTIPAGAASVVVMVGVGSGVFVVAGSGESAGQVYYPPIGKLLVNGSTVVPESSSAIIWALASPGAGTYTVTAERTQYSETMYLVVMVNKR